MIGIRPGSLGFALKEKLYLGNTLYNIDEIRYLSYLISFAWKGLTYDPFTKNCNNFTKFFAESILKCNVNYPIYINRFTHFRTIFTCLYEPFKALVGDIVQMKPDLKNKEETNEKIQDQNIGDNIESSSAIGIEIDNQISIEQDIKIKPIRISHKSRMSKRIKRYKVKPQSKLSIVLLRDYDKVNNPCEKTVLITSKTRVINHNDFFKNFDQKVLTKFEINLLNEFIPLKISPRLFIEETDSTSFLKEITHFSDLTLDRNTYENFEEILTSINHKINDNNFCLQKRKLFFLNNLVKYMKIAVKLCLTG